MLFNSFEFYAFFAIFLLLFFCSPIRLQPVILLVASYIFYMGWRPVFALLLAFTTIVDYTTAMIMAGATTARVRTAAMAIALCINIGILVIVKYLDFGIASVVDAASIFGISIPSYALNIVLPLGISFYTFQSIGYTLDVYNRRVPAEKSPLAYAQYVAFFPQLVAGPIERAAHMLPQFHRRHAFSLSNLYAGAWLIGFGLFKKMCIADAVAPAVGGVFADPLSFPAFYQIMAVVLFALQIYCDFSGYSDIARGVARVMGFDLMINFRQPYFATSLTEFWRRWHISLSTWFRDFLYVPIGGSRGSKFVVARNLMIVFLVSGIWHGAAWTFLIWGALHGVGLVIERLAGKRAHQKQNALSAVLGWLWTASLVLAGWVFFRAASLRNAVDVFRQLGDLRPPSFAALKVLGLAEFDLAVLAISLLILFSVDYVLAGSPGAVDRLRTSRWCSTLGGVALAYYIILFGMFGHRSFIYFQF